MRGRRLVKSRRYSNSMARYASGSACGSVSSFAFFRSLSRACRSRSSSTISIFSRRSCQGAGRTLSGKGAAIGVHTAVCDDQVDDQAANRRIIDPDHQVFVTRRFAPRFAGRNTPGESPEAGRLAECETPMRGISRVIAVGSFKMIRMNSRSFGSRSLWPDRGRARRRRTAGPGRWPTDALRPETATEPALSRRRCDAAPTPDAATAGACR